MDKNGLLIQVIAMRGKYPDRKVLMWRSLYGPRCNECAENILMSPYFLECGEGYPRLTLFGDKHHPSEDQMACLGCHKLLKDHP